MNIFITYYAKDDSIPKAINLLKRTFEIENHSVAVTQIIPRLKLKEYDYSKLEFIEFKSTVFDSSSLMRRN